MPFALTEEFAAVYRMHPLLPDYWTSAGRRRPARSATTRLRDLSGPTASTVLGKHPLADLLYSFGTQHPGLVSLHNFPRFLQHFVRPDGKIMDLAATDILRHRELGVPRYCEFRRLLHLTPPARFEDLTDNPSRRRVAPAYGRRDRRLDLMVGLFAEGCPRASRSATPRSASSS